MNDQLINKANRNFNNMTKEQKDEVVGIINAAALSIELKTGTWQQFMLNKTHSTRGCQHRFYSILARFNRRTIEQFVSAYCEPL